MSGYVGGVPRTHRLTGVVNGTIVTAGVLAVSAAEIAPSSTEVAVYAFATVIVFWLAHAWAHALGRRDAGEPGHRLIDSLRYELPVLEAVVPPLVALALARLAGADDETAITIAAWVCVIELGLFGGGVARRQGSPFPRVALTAASCAALGLALILLKAVVS